MANDRRKITYAVSIWGDRILRRTIHEDGRWTEGWYDATTEYGRKVIQSAFDTGAIYAIQKDVLMRRRQTA